MRKFIFTSALSAAIVVSGCATSGSQQRNRELTGVAAGVALGGALGAVSGHGAIQGGILGGLAGGAIGALAKPNQRQYYRDTRGYCYWVDASGTPYYDMSVKC